MAAGSVFYQVFRFVNTNPELRSIYSIYFFGMGRGCRVSTGARPGKGRLRWDRSPHCHHDGVAGAEQDAVAGSLLSFEIAELRTQEMSKEYAPRTGSDIIKDPTRIGQARNVQGIRTAHGK